MKNGIRKISCFFLVLGILAGIMNPVHLKAASKKKFGTVLYLGYKAVIVPVPTKDYITDRINYSLHYVSEEDRWSVQTTILTRKEDLASPNFVPAKSFSKSKLKLIGTKYYMDVKLKGLSYEITYSFTKKYRDFFENLSEKDFKVEQNGGKRYKKRLAGLLLLNLSPKEIKETTLNKQNPFKNVKSGEILEEVKKIVKDNELLYAYVSNPKDALKRQKAGILLAESFNGTDIEVAMVKMINLYVALGYQPIIYEKDANFAYLELKKGNRLSINLLVYDRKKINKHTGKEVEGTDKTLVYVLKEPI